MRGGYWCQCDNVTISHNEVKKHEWKHRLHWRTRGCSGSCVCGQEECCRRAGDCSIQEALADSNGEGSEEDDNKDDKENKGSKGKATRVMMETPPREEGDNGHNNQLGT